VGYGEEAWWVGDLLTALGNLLIFVLRSCNLFENEKMRKMRKIFFFEKIFFFIFFCRRGLMCTSGISWATVCDLGDGLRNDCGRRGMCVQSVIAWSTGVQCGLLLCMWAW
jgi:hypothetical protein